MGLPRESQVSRAKGHRLPGKESRPEYCSTQYDRANEDDASNILRSSSLSRARPYLMAPWLSSAFSLVIIIGKTISHRFGQILQSVGKSHRRRLLPSVIVGFKRRMEAWKLETNRASRRSCSMTQEFFVQERSGRERREIDGGRRCRCDSWILHAAAFSFEHLQQASSALIDSRSNDRLLSDSYVTSRIPHTSMAQADSDPRSIFE